MAYINVSIIFPGERTPQVVETYMGVIKKYPPNEDLAVEVVPGEYRNTLSGVEGHIILEVKPGMLDQAFQRVAAMQMMYSRIPDYSYSIEIFYSIEESLAVAGFGTPK